MKQKKERCLPLEVLRDYRGIQDASFYSILQHKGIRMPENATRRDVLDRMSSDEFLRGSAGEWKEVDMLAARVYANLLENTDAKEKNIDLFTETRDQLCYTDMVLLWGDESKQVYRIDPDFLRELVETENLYVTADAIRSLPFRDFYIDFGGAPETYPVEGAFVHAAQDRSGPQVNVLMVTADKVIFSYYSNYTYGEDGVMEFTGKMVPTCPFVAKASPDFYDFEGAVKNYGEDTRPKAIRAIIQAIMFLSAGNSDVLESPSSVRTYRPTAYPKDRYSEIRTWDVGVRYGKAIRIAKDEAGKAVRKEKGDGSSSGEAARSRKPMRPHMRRAHWHRYRIGKGRKEIRLNWNPPSFICGGHEIPVTIQEIKKG